MKNHNPLHLPVKRPGAEIYLLLSLLSFALSVTGTRLLLELTGYPQLYNSEGWRFARNQKGWENEK